MLTLPPTYLLSEANLEQLALEEADQSQRIRNALERAGVSIDEVDVEVRASVVRYGLSLTPGTAPSKVERAIDQVSMATGRTARYVGITGHTVTVEVPRAERALVTLRSVLESAPANPGALPIPVGEAVVGGTMLADLAAFPHLLVAGTTGAGKSEFINSLITGLVMTHNPGDLHMVLVDPKRVELTAFARLPHLLGEIVTDPADAANVLKVMVARMEERFTTFEQYGVKSLGEYNSLVLHTDREDAPTETMPRIVIVIDELADLMMTSGKSVEDSIIRIGQLARAAGIHLVLATQRPAADVVTKKISANIPARAVFAVQSHVESNIALGQRGAERLTGKGDGFLKTSGGSAPVRFQGAYVSRAEIERVVKFWVEEWAKVQRITDRALEAAEALENHVEQEAEREADRLRAEREAEEAAERERLDRMGWKPLADDVRIDEDPLLELEETFGKEVVDALVKRVVDEASGQIAERVAERLRAEFGGAS